MVRVEDATAGSARCPARAGTHRAPGTLVAFSAVSNTAGWVLSALRLGGEKGFGEVRGLAPRGTAWRAGIQTEASVAQGRACAPGLLPLGSGVHRPREAPREPDTGLPVPFVREPTTKTAARLHLSLFVCASVHGNGRYSDVEPGAGVHLEFGKWK